MKRLLILALCLCLIGGLVGCVHNNDDTTETIQTWEDDMLTKEYIIEHSSLTEEDLSPFDLNQIIASYKLTKEGFNEAEFIEILRFEADKNQITDWRSIIGQEGRSGSALDGNHEKADLTGGLNVEPIDIEAYKPTPEPEESEVDENAEKPEFIDNLTNAILSGLIISIGGNNENVADEVVDTDVQP